MSFVFETHDNDIKFASWLLRFVKDWAAVLGSLFMVLRFSMFGFVMSPAIAPILLLCLSNLFMTVAWYGHLRALKDRPVLVAALVSWGIALFEYLLQVPANRIGATAFSLPQLKVMQEVITLVVFVPFAVWYMKQPVRLDFLWAGLCLLGAVYFVFRGA